MEGVGNDVLNININSVAFKSILAENILNAVRPFDGSIGNEIRRCFRNYYKNDLRRRRK